MSYLASKDLADKAATAAVQAQGQAEDLGVIQLAKSVELLSKAVSEMAAQLRRDN